MALYATDGEKILFAPDANPRRIYRCLGCGALVRVRRGLHRFPHFYHIRSPGSCHLYSKTEDHQLLQLQLSSLFPKGKVLIEQPFLDIQRVADLLWEEKRIIFEIQCSLIQPADAEQRIIDYRRLGYEIIWLLDDRLFNKRWLRPAESFLRGQTAYFFSFRRALPSIIYDQCEILIQKRRWRKGFFSKVNLLSPKKIPAIPWPTEIPEQLSKRAKEAIYYFKGDLLYRTLQSTRYPTTALALAYWRKEELAIAKKNRPPSLLWWFLKTFLLIPARLWFDDFSIRHGVYPPDRPEN
ncbi:MAG: hypothetical protein KGI80_00540 [Verrucomicrobiota bacterium]|nr:hypothetical protein [Verrucomicrobiota bacterium]